MATGNEKTYTSQERLAQLHLAESLYDAGLYKSAQLIVRQEKTGSCINVISLCLKRVIPSLSRLSTLLLFATLFVPTIDGHSPMHGPKRRKMVSGECHVPVRSQSDQIGGTSARDCMVFNLSIYFSPVCHRKLSGAKANRRKSGTMANPHRSLLIGILQVGITHRRYCSTARPT